LPTGPVLAEFEAGNPCSLIQTPMFTTALFRNTNVVLIGLCCLMFLYELAVGGVEAQVFFLKWGFIPEELIRSQPYSTIVTE